MAIGERGETAFDEAGDGYILCFTNADMKRLQAAFGKSFVPNFTSDMLNGGIDVEMMEAVVGHGLKDRDRKPVPFDAVAEKLDTLPIADVMEKVFDALYQAVHGKTFKVYLDETTKALSEAQERGDPPSQFRPDTTISTTSDTAPSGQASA